MVNFFQFSDPGIVFIGFLGYEDVDKRIVSRFQNDGIFGRVQACWNSVVGIDYSKGNVGQAAGNGSCIQFRNLKLCGFSVISATVVVTFLISLTLISPALARTKIARPPLDGSLGIPIVAPSEWRRLFQSFGVSGHREVNGFENFYQVKFRLFLQSGI